MSTESLVEQENPQQPATESSTESNVTELNPGTSKAPDQPGRRGRPRAASTARKTRTVELILTVTGTADGEWQAELKHGSRRVVQGLEIAAAAVARAAKELHPDIYDEIDTVISTAREQHRQRLAELSEEMEKVKRALAELDA